MDIIVEQRSINCTGEAPLDMETAMVRSIEWTDQTHLQIENVPKRGTIKWTEKARCQLLEAVIKVEEDIRDESKHVSGSSTGKRTREWSGTQKWDAILNLLPADLQERTWSNNRQMYNIPKCRVMFYYLLKRYKEKLAGTTSRTCLGTCRRPSMTEPVFRMFMRWDGVVNGRGRTVPDESFSRSETPESLNTARSSHDGEQHPSKCEMSLEEKSTSSVREDGTAESFEHTDKFQTPEDGENFDVNLERKEGTHLDDDKFIKRARADTTQPSRSVDDSLSAPLSVVQTSVRLAAQTLCQAKSESIAQISDSTSPTRRPPIKCQASSPCRRRKAGKSRESNDQEHLQAMINRALRKLDLEFSRLSSCVQNEAIPVGKSVSHKIISSEMGSGGSMNASAHRSGTATERFDRLIQKSMERTIENQIRASFQKLRTRFVMNLKETSVGVATEIVKETKFLKSIPYRTHSRRKTRHGCP